jgi:hypothetical protein
MTISNVLSFASIVDDEDITLLDPHVDMQGPITSGELVLLYI